MDKATRAILKAYIDEVSDLPNEAAKTHRFVALVHGLFPGSSRLIDVSRNIGKVVRIATDEGPKRRILDSYFGNAIIEFEASLAATGTEAQKQLREQVAGIWSKEGLDRPLVAIASDGIEWRVYHPERTGSGGRTLRPEHVRLVDLRSLSLTDDSIDEFWLWLTGLLFRRGQRAISPDSFRFDFGAQSVAFRASMGALSSAWGKARRKGEAELKLKTWKNYLAFSYGSIAESQDLETLFLKHTYLASVARLLVWATISHGKTDRPLREVAHRILTGDFFREAGIQNLVEMDFFSWVTESDLRSDLDATWERILDQLLTYDLRVVGHDLLKGVYEELVDPSDRHDLGEYYTPDWLCEAVVKEALPAKGFVRVLDPTCGSGSFLRAAIDHLLKNNRSGGDDFRLHAILNSVVGVEIHPLAVTIARATYAIALGPLLRAPKRPIQIPVYLADSLFLPVELTQLELGQIRSYEIRFADDRRVSMPEDLVRSAEWFDAAMEACTVVARDHAESGAENAASLGAYLARVNPKMGEHEDYSHFLSSLWQFTTALADLIHQHRDSIWAFVVKNSYRPATWRGTFDVIVGNPPWLSYRYIADPAYQAEIKKLAIDDYGIAPRSQELITQMELATIFLVHTLHVYGKDGARLAFVMPRGILSADQHATLRSGQHLARVRLEKYWDLLEVSPLFNVPSCVMFAERKPPVTTNSYSLPVVEWSGELPSRDISFDAAEEHLHTRHRSGRLIYLGNRTALSTLPGRVLPNAPSSYARRFRDGATVYPRNFYFVEVADLDENPEPERLYTCRTEPEQARLAKKPYKGLEIRGQVEGAFLYRVALSKHVLPFLVLQPAEAVLPIRRLGGKVQVLNVSELRKLGFRETAKWMAKVEKEWASTRGAKTSTTATEYLDYQGKLTSQPTGVAPLVLYNASGTDLSAAVVEPHAFGGRLIVDHKLYWLACDSAEEAHYVCAFLNAASVNEAIKPFQSMGLMGERDIHKKVLDLPIPSFDPRIRKHQQLARLGAKAAAAVGRASESEEARSGLARRRHKARNSIIEERKEIDRLVLELLT